MKRQTCLFFVLLNSLTLIRQCGVFFLPQIFSVGGISMGVNYGANKVRFISPVPVGAELRAGIKVLAVDDTPGGARVTLETTFECKGAAKPSCIAEVIFQYFF